MGVLWVCEGESPLAPWTEQKIALSSSSPQCWQANITGPTRVQFPGGAVVKNPPTNAGMQETQFQSLCQEEPWGRKWQLASAFLPGKFHGERSLVGYSPWGHKRATKQQQQKSKFTGFALSATESSQWVSHFGRCDFQFSNLHLLLYVVYFLRDCF